MNIEECFDHMKNFQRDLLEYIESESNIEEKYENFAKNLKDEQILEDHHELKELLYLINDIGNNHQRSTNFIYKIEKIFHNLKNDITKNFSNSEIFELFRFNKRLLLFLINEKIIIIDEYIVSQITNNEFFENKYPEYFAPEIKPFLTKEFIKKYCEKNSCLENDDLIKEITKEYQDDFFEKRKNGENDNYLCEIIRLGQKKEFIDHVNKTNLSFDSYIQESIFETNPLLMNNNKKTKIIEYASFFGSIEIIKYMHENGAELTQNMYIYAIHSKNVELIKYLEDNQLSLPENDKILKESIKCHHNDISNYLINNIIKDEELQYNVDNKFNENIYRYSFEYHNYCFFPKNLKYKYIFYYLCEFDYYKLVSLYLKNMNIDINEVIIIKNQYFK